MRTRITLLVCLASFLAQNAIAQNYKWVIGGGSTTTPAGGIYTEEAEHMLTDSNQNLYIVSPMGDDDIQADTFYLANAFTKSTASNNPHIFFASYSKDGKMRWAKLIESQIHSLCYGLAYDGAKSLYIVGYLWGGNKHIGYDTIITDANYSAFIAKYDTSGTFKWIRFVGPDIPHTALATGGRSTIAIDGNGYIHYYTLVLRGVQLTPTILSDQGTYDLKYDSSGNLLSATKMSIDSFAYCRQVLFNKKSGNLFANIMSADFSGDLLGQYIAAYTANDSIIWIDSIVSGTVSDIIYDQQNSIYGIGYGALTPFILGSDTIQNSLTTVNVFFKTDTFGKIRWITRLDGTPPTSVYVLYQLCMPKRNLLSAAGVFVTKATYGRDSIVSTPGEGWNPLFITTDTAGKLIKLDQLHGDAFYDFGTAITADKVGNIYIGGGVGDSIYTKGIPAYHSIGGDADFFVMKYGYNDGCTLSTEPTPMFTVSGDSTHVPATMNFTYTGTNTPDSVRWEFGDGSISKMLSPSHIYTDTGTIQVCLTVYGCDSGTYCNWVTTLKPTAVNNIRLFPALEVYPNPVTDRLTIANINEGTMVQLYDIVGSKVFSTNANNDKLTIDMHNIAAGTYMLLLTNKDGQKESMRIMKQ